MSTLVTSPRTVSLRGLALAITLVMAAGCSGSAPSSSTPARREAAAPAVAALRDGRFAESRRAAERTLAGDPDNSVAAVVRAVARYRDAMERLRRDVDSVGSGLDGPTPALDDAALRTALMRAETELAAVDRDLAIAAADPAFELELCLACWREDWNGNGRLDDGDELLLQVEMNADGSEIPEGDPRRKPTFRFDTGDVHWARAMLAFQRAGMNLVAAYRWNEVSRFGEVFGGQLKVIRFPLDDASKVRRGRDLALEGLDHADRSREAYLAESDDEREWVPSPRQKDHPLPLPVDAALYDTWDAIIDDVRRLLRGEEGLDMAEIVRTVRADWQIRPGYLDIGRMFAEPRDIVVDLSVLASLDDGTPAGIDAAMRSFFGVYYVDRMKPSPLVARLARMRSEIERGDESFGRKLRYLLWLN